MGSETTYVVLRDLQRNQLVDPFSTRSASRWETTRFRPPEPRIDTESTDIRGRNELFRMPKMARDCGNAYAADNSQGLQRGE